MRRRWWRSAPAAFAVALLVAVLVTGGQGYLYYAQRTPAAALAARVGESVTLAGTQVSVRSIAVAATMPDTDAGDPPVTGPAGSVLVLVTWQQTILDDTVPLDAHFCDATLVADDGTVWTDDLDYTYDLRRPQRLTCSGTDDAPLARNVPVTVGESYVIPAGYGSRVTWRLSWDDDAHVVVFSP
ncbi:hypothetical protein [uncultured Friedmanniella sp.]|uniref:hypothetical protein n=1 Tax=uncultured Friedmanniella sp. TaxID=335381 RepID=UPI0035CB48AE